MSNSPIHPGTRRRVYERDNRTCVYCARKCDESCSKARATIDHILPRSRGGSSRYENLVTACFSCNGKKRDRSVEWLRERLEGAA